MGSGQWERGVCVAVAIKKIGIQGLYQRVCLCETLYKMIITWQYEGWICAVVVAKMIDLWNLCPRNKFLVNHA